MPEPITTFGAALIESEPVPDVSAAATEKKNYAERLSRALSTLVANGLRGGFPGVTPNSDGSRQEVRARTAKGFKKLDVGYSTPELGLALGVSIKTLNFRDGSSGRYTKNYSRIDNELRAEASDYHVRQPFAVLVGILYLPVDSSLDANPDSKASSSSFASAVRYFRNRTDRAGPHDGPELFELFLIGLYNGEPSSKWSVRYFDVGKNPPRARQPTAEETWSQEEMLALITSTYDERNDPPFEFVD